MKLVLLLAVVGLAYSTFCGSPENYPLKDTIKTIALQQVKDIFGHCKPFNNAVDRMFAPKNAAEGCSKVFDEGYCFVANSVSNLSQSPDLTYNDMANYISETGNGRKLANQYCSFGLPCVDKVVKTMRNCAKKDADFWEKSALKIEEKINSDMVQNLITQMTADMDEGSFKSLIEMIQTEITSYQDLKDLIDEQISVETQEKMISQAKEGLKNFIRGSQNFCKNRCVAKSADFFEAAFLDTHDTETCPVVGMFCGGCKANMDGFVEDSAIPCCTKNAVKKLAGSIISTFEEYKDMFVEKEALVLDAISDVVLIEDIQVYNYVKIMIGAEASCLKDTYEKLSDVTCTELA